MILRRVNALIFESKAPPFDGGAFLISECWLRLLPMLIDHPPWL